MLTLRPLRWPDDRPAILELDASFTTGQVYRIVPTEGGFELREEVVSPPLERRFDLTPDVDQFPGFDYVLIAELDGRAAGVAALFNETENRRAIVKHLYVDRGQRRQGVGKALMEALIARAQEWRSRCVWLETQDVNYDAIRFYKRAGFEWCGLDRSLDEHDGSARDETAVFFMRSLR
jgi:GNAT superfamily N-acetyltransferase